MLRSPLARHLLGIALGAMAGASLSLSVLPMALQLAGYGSHLAIAAYLARSAGFAALVMAAGGWGVARSRHPLQALAVFSLAGLATGLMLAGVSLGREPRLMAAAAGAGWLYGLLGGIVLGRVLAPPPAGRDEEDSAAGHGESPPGQDGPAEAGTEAGAASVDDPRDYP